MAPRASKETDNFLVVESFPPSNPPRNGVSINAIKRQIRSICFLFSIPRNNSCHLRRLWVRDYIMRIRKISVLEFPVTQFLNFPGKGRKLSYMLKKRWLSLWCYRFQTFETDFFWFIITAYP